MVDYEPNGGGGPNGLELTLSGTITSGEYRGELTLFQSNQTPYDISADDLWIMDENNLIVDFMAWDDGSGGQIYGGPDSALGLWDSNGSVEISGDPNPGIPVSISLATLTDANSAACWEFTASGNASSGTHQCAAADTFVTIDQPAADTVVIDIPVLGPTVYNVPPGWRHSWRVPEPPLAPGTGKKAARVL